MTRLAPGTAIGDDFVIERALSEGGMGAVYVAMQRSTGVSRAVKTMHGELLGDERLRARFVEEARLAATIPSDHVVKVLGAGWDSHLGLPWLAMELLPGKPLTTALEQITPFSPALTEKVLEQACHGLGAAAALGITHRDVKPDNLFVSPSNTVGLPFVLKVLDFGIAKQTLGAGPKSTQVVGTPFWLAPEQTDTRPRISPATDVWPIGLIAFACLTGKNFWHTAYEPEASMQAFLRELVIDEIPAASVRAAERGAAVPGWFDGWFARCVARDPDARFADAREAFSAFASAREASGDHAAVAPSETARFLAALSGDPVRLRTVFGEPVRNVPGRTEKVTEWGEPLHQENDRGAAKSGMKSVAVWAAVTACALFGIFYANTVGPKRSVLSTTSSLSVPPVANSATASRSDVADPLGGRFTMDDVRQTLKGPLVATIETSAGTISCKLFDDKAPLTVANFVGLANALRPYKDSSGSWVKKHAYDGVPFHQIVKNFMMKGGDIVRQNGWGEPGYTIPDENWPGASHDRPGQLCMANRGPNTNGSQFFITDGAATSLDGSYTIFGSCSPERNIHTIVNTASDGRVLITSIRVSGRDENAESAKTDASMKALREYYEALEARQLSKADELLRAGDVGDNYRSAVAACNEAIRLDPTRAQGWVCLGHALEVSGDRDGARAAYRDCTIRAESGPTKVCLQRANGAAP